MNKSKRQSISTTEEKQTRNNAAVISRNGSVERQSSPFFLKQVDVTDNMVKYDPNQSSDNISITSFECQSPVKKLDKKLRGQSHLSHSAKRYDLCIFWSFYF